MFARQCNHIIQLRINHIHLNPFNLGLKNGTLPSAVFLRFLNQDRIYLKGLAKTHQMIAERCSEEHKALFLQFSKSALGEIDTIDYYLQPTQAARFFCSKPITPPILPVVRDYLYHMSALSSEAPIEIAIASVLPCFYIYCQLGAFMQRERCNNNPFQKWIDSYADKNFLASANQLMNIAEESAANSRYEAWMLEAFSKSVDFEIAFWDAVCDLSFEEIASTEIDNHGRTQ